MSVFIKSFPVILTSFINKSGAIGISLIPMLLVQRELSPDQAIWSMMLIKGAAIGGILVGGVLCDRVGVRWCLLLSFSLVGGGLASLPFAHSLCLLLVFGMMSQLGNSMHAGAARLLIIDCVERAEQKEAIGWQRMANNFGQIISFSIGTLCAGHGIAALMFFNAVTSLAATGVGSRILPSASAHSVPTKSRESKLRPSWLGFGICAVVIGGYNSLYELFMVGSAARCKLIFGEAQGVAIFSQIMVVNTVLCTFFAVSASKIFRDPRTVFPLGLFLVAAGSSLAFAGETCRWRFVTGSLILTCGEIIFTSICGYVLLCVTPCGKHRSSIYSLALVIHSLGSMAGAGLAFHTVVYGGDALRLIWIGAVVFIALSLLGCRIFVKYLD